MSNGILRLISLGLLAMVLIGATFKLVRNRVQISVVDALGSNVGTVAGFAINASGGLMPIVALSIDNKLALVAVDPTKFRGTSPANMVYFETLDCTGAPFFDANEFPAPEVRGPGPYTHLAGNRVSFLDLNTAPHRFDVEMHSAMDADTLLVGGHSGLCVPGTYPLADAYEGEFLGDLDDLFVPPFSMR